MSAVVAPSGECLRGDGRCADRIISNLALLYLAAYLPVLNPCLACVPWCTYILHCQLLYLVYRVMSSNNKAVDFDLLI